MLIKKKKSNITACTKDNVKGKSLCSVQFNFVLLNCCPGYNLFVLQENLAGKFY